MTARQADPTGVQLRVPGADDDEVRERLVLCLAVPRWIEEVTAAGPFTSVDALVGVARGAAVPLTDDEIDAALARHPAIGATPSQRGVDAELSRNEQATLGASDAATEAALRETNEAYRRRFGRVFLIRAAGRTRAEVLAELRRRIESTPAEESAELSEQLHQIAALRIRTLFADRRV